VTKVLASCGYLVEEMATRDRETFCLAVPQAANLT